MKPFRATAALAMAMAATLSVPSPARAASENLLCNGGFEVETPTSAHDSFNWKMNTPDAHGDSWGSAHREDWRSHNGYYLTAIRGTWANAGDNGGVWQEQPANPGSRYTASVWTWADHSWKPKTQQLKIEFWNRDGSAKIFEEVLDLINPGETWAEQSLGAKAPSDAAWIRVVVTVEGTGPQGALQIDDVSLRRED